MDKVSPFKIKSGKLISVNGRSRSGKTFQVLRLLAEHERGLIWDIEQDYAVDYRAFTLRELTGLIQKHKGKKVFIGYSGALADIGGFCERAFAYISMMGAAGKRSVIVCEETSDFTNPNWAPKEYAELLRKGLKRGADLICVTQRLAESDKTAIGNASVVHVSALKLAADRKRLCAETDMPLSVIAGLRFDRDNSVFDYLVIDDSKQAYRRGVLTFRKDKPVYTDEKGWISIAVA